MQVIYLDVLFVLNALMDGCMLCAAAALCGQVLQKRRICAGAAAGALWAVISVLWTPAASVPARVLCGALMTVIAFGVNGVRRTVRSLMSVWLVSFVFGGCVTALASCTSAVTAAGTGIYLPVTLEMIAAAAVCAWAITALVFRRRAAEDIPRGETVSIEFLEKNIRVHLLPDSGNALRDPVSGLPVLIIDRASAMRLFPPELRFVPMELRRHNSAELLCRLGKHTGEFRLVSCHTVSGEGLMLCFRPRRVVRENGAEYPALVALTADHVEDYDGLIAPIRGAKAVHS
ncbi:MAG: sigma-E processing peptidase SpoIIGA [Butyricicoccaceae bacterium]